MKSKYFIWIAVALFFVALIAFILALFTVSKRLLFKKLLFS